MKLIEILLVLSIIGGGVTIAEQGLDNAFDLGQNALEQIRVHEEGRQQQIQNLVCEMNGTTVSDCPVIHLEQTVLSDK